MGVKSSRGLLCSYGAFLVPATFYPWLHAWADRIEFLFQKPASVAWHQRERLFLSLTKLKASAAV